MSINEIEAKVGIRCRPYDFYLNRSISTERLDELLQNAGINVSSAITRLFEQGAKASDGRIYGVYELPENLAQRFLYEHHYALHGLEVRPEKRMPFAQFCDIVKGHYGSKCYVTAEDLCDAVTSLGWNNIRLLQKRVYDSNGEVLGVQLLVVGIGMRGTSLRKTKHL